MPDESADSNNAPIDFPQVSEPAPASPPPTPRPARSNEVKVSVNGPLSQVVESMSNLQGSRSTMPSLAGTHTRFRNSIEQLAQIANSPDAVMYQLEIKRMGPASWDGEALPTSVLERVPPMPYPDLYERVRQVHGGGSYRVTVYDNNSMTVFNFPFTIDTVIDPPKIKIGNQIVQAGFGNNVNRPGYAGQRPSLSTSPLAAEAEDDLQTLRVEERKLAAQQAVKQKKREMEVQEKRWKEEENQERTRAEREANSPILAQIGTLERNMQAALMQQQQQFQQMLLALKDSNKGDDKTILLMVESMKMQSQQQQAAMQASMQMFGTMMQTMTQVSQTKSSEQAEMVKLQAENNRNMLEMTVKSAQGGNSRYDKLIEAMLQQSLHAKSNSVKEALDLVSLGREQALEMVERNSPNEDLSYDPKAGVLGNLGKLIFGLLGGLLKGAGGAQGIGAVLQALGQNNAANVTQDQLHNLAAVMEKQYATGTLPAGALRGLPPVNNAMVPAAAARPASQQPMIFEEEPVQQRPAQAQPVVQTPMVTGTVSSPTLQQQVPDVQAGASQRLIEVVTEAVELAIEDINNGVRDADWPDFALGKWPKQFLDQICALPDLASRIDLLSKVCDPTVFNQGLYPLLANEQKPENYANFIRALDSLVAEHLNGAAVGV